MLLQRYTTSKDRMKIEILVLLCGVISVETSHRRWSKDRYVPKTRPFNIQPFISDLLNNIAGIFKFPRPQQQKYDVGTIEPGQAQFIKDGASQAIMYRSKQGSSGGFAFSSGNGRGFSITSDGSRSRNVVLGSDGKTNEAFLKRTKSLPLFGSKGLLSKLLQNF